MTWVEKEVEAGPMGRKANNRKHPWAELVGRVLEKWKVMAERKFDVRQGKLVTLLRCARCGKEQTKLL